MTLAEPHRAGMGNSLGQGFPGQLSALRGPPTQALLPTLCPCLCPYRAMGTLQRKGLCLIALCPQDMATGILWRILSLTGVNWETPRPSSNQRGGAFEEECPSS